MLTASINNERRNTDWILRVFGQQRQNCSNHIFVGRYLKDVTSKMSFRSGTF
jgi:hypothetical protein